MSARKSSHGTIGSPVGADRLQPALKIEKALLPHDSALAQIERRADRSPLQPGPQALASDWPGFSVTADRQIGKCGAGGGVKDLDNRRLPKEPIDSPALIAPIVACIKS